MNELISFPPPALDHPDKSSLETYFRNTWELNDLLFKAVHNERSLYLNPDPLRNPLIFYLGHTAAFYVNKLKGSGLLANGIEPEYERLFAVGVDPHAPEELKKEFRWPLVEEVWTYRQRVFDTVMELIPRLNLEKLINWDDPEWAFFMSLEHDRIHFETSSMLIRQLGTEHLTCPDPWNYCESTAEVKPLEFITVEGGTIQLGRKEDWKYYSWDNEFGGYSSEVAPFEVGKRLITNAEFLEFVKDDGYTRESLWENDGWKWLKETGTYLPKFWIKRGDGYNYRALFNDFELPGSWPAEVNYHEARAYCTWKGSEFRMMTEPEYQQCVVQHGGTTEFDNINLRFGSPTPVGFGQEDNAVTDLNGNVWEWLSSSFYPYEGFKPHPLYKDYSNLFFDDDHKMLAGGSWASTGTTILKHYRQWFRKHFFQHAGFRLAKDC